MEAEQQKLANWLLTISCIGRLCAGRASVGSRFLILAAANAAQAPMISNGIGGSIRSHWPINFALRLVERFPVCTLLARNSDCLLRYGKSFHSGWPLTSDLPLSV